jgi:anti-sigma-K factor RskA
VAELRPHSEPHPDVAGYLLGGLEPAEAEAFADHLATCRVCREEVAALAGLPGLLTDLPAPAPLPPGLEARTWAGIESEPTVTGGAIVDLSGARRRRSWRVATAAAAAVVLLVSGVAIASRLRHPTPTPQVTLQLVAAGGAAHGTASLDPTGAGVTIHMTVTDLAASPPGTVYACWLTARDDRPGHPDRVWAGSFVVPDAHSTVTVQWTVPADPGHFSHVGVSQEGGGGNPGRYTLEG